MRQEARNPTILIGYHGLGFLSSKKCHNASSWFPLGHPHQRIGQQGNGEDGVSLSNVKRRRFLEGTDKFWVAHWSLMYAPRFGRLSEGRLH
jgi:hypothetical protein